MNYFRNFKTICFTSLALTLFNSAYADPSQDLAKAVKEHNIDAMKAAIAAGADVNAKDAEGNTPLGCAVWWTDEVALLIEAKADVNLNNPLISAATWGETESLNLLLKAGANVNAKNGLGQTALWSAAFNGNQLSTLQALINAGAEVDAKDNLGQTPLITLAANGKTPKERVATINSQSPYLVKAGLALPPRLLNPKESDYSNVGEMIKFLVEKKADVNYSFSAAKFTALILAAQKNRPDAVQALIDSKADLELKSLSNMTPLAHACFSNKGEEAGLVLVNAGANINVTDRMSLEWQDSKYSGSAVFTNVTPLFLAAGRGYAKLVQAEFNQ